MTKSKNVREAFKQIPSLDEILKSIDLKSLPLHLLKTKIKDAKGKFGRVIAEVWAEFEKGSLRNINELMIKECYAVKYYAENKALIEEAHLVNRQLLIEKGLFVPVEPK